MLQPSQPAQSVISEHLITGLCLLLLLAGSISLAYQGAAFWRLLHSPINLTPVQQAPVEPVIDQQQLATLFGVPLLDSSGPAPATALQLTLMAAFNHPQSSRSSAIIGRDGQVPERFMVGATIAPGVTLESVQRQHVTLLRHGRRESLHFPDKPSQPLTPAANPIASGLLSQASSRN
ncbi:type II secretion system protein N [Pseudomonas anguilliseptica]|uniref:type II secretion system protein N n=1 Tax=Pseudomonas anguilliseptica TaxID=53406 RepID=UPI0022AEAC34|nr:type II secretion system protein N [Pseudomonas anguilliseptica]MCZ4320766.1 secretion protein XcpP [Pseudomonas anguilliseptica]